MKNYKVFRFIFTNSQFHDTNESAFYAQSFRRIGHISYADKKVLLSCKIKKDPPSDSCLRVNPFTILLISALFLQPLHLFKDHIVQYFDIGAFHPR